MKRLYAPWRSSYVKTERGPGCPFCAALSTSNNRAHYVIRRDTDVIVMMNKYPYNAGHLLIVPVYHESNMSVFPESLRAEIMEKIDWSINLLKKRLKCDGINVGLNMGSASGGSLPDHMHWHVVPRWEGDGNFLTACADTKVVAVDLDEIYDELTRETFL